MDELINFDWRKRVNDKIARAKKDPSSSSAGLEANTEENGKTQLLQTKFDLPKETILELREMLHPNHNFRFKMTPSNWIPGMRSEFQKNYINRNMLPKNVKRAQSAAIPIQKRKDNINNLIKDMEKGRSRPMVRCSSAYVTDIEKRLKEDKENQKKIISQKNVVDPKTKTFYKTPVPFLTTNKANMIETFSDFEDKGSIRGKYRPVSAHKFRNKDRAKWITKKGFKLS